MVAPLPAGIAIKAALIDLSTISAEKGQRGGFGRDVFIALRPVARGNVILGPLFELLVESGGQFRTGRGQVVRFGRIGRDVVGFKAAMPIPDQVVVAHAKCGESAWPGGVDAKLNG